MRPLLLLLSVSSLANEAVDRVFAGLGPSTPGCAVGVTQQGKLVFAKGYGAANLDYGLPLGAASVFDIGSVSKQFVVFSLLLLEEDGRLSLDDDVARHFPAVPGYGAPIRIRHLVHHTSGIRDYLELLAISGKGRDFVTPADVRRLLARQRELNFAPGSAHLYSNSGYFVLGQIIERVSGKSLAQFARERIFDPLGMANTHFQDEHREVLRNRATGYQPHPVKGFLVSLNPYDIVGDGGVYSTVEDLAKWDANFWSRTAGGVSLWAKMLQPARFDSGGNAGQSIPYGGGLRLVPHRGAEMISHGGSWAGFRAEALRFPAENLGVICLCNRADANPTELALRVAETYLGSKLGPAQPPPAPGDPPAAPRALASAYPIYPGRYRSDELDVVWEVSLQGRDLFLRRSPGSLDQLSPVADGEFAVRNLRLAFERAGDAVTGFRLSAGRVRNIRFERAAADKPFDVFAWVEHIRGLSAETPGKQAYVAFLKERYGYQIARLAEAYGIGAQSFTELETFDWRTLDRARPAVRADDRAFGEVIRDKAGR